MEILPVSRKITTGLAELKILKADYTYYWGSFNG
jgi:hypothetical protein